MMLTNTRLPTKVSGRYLFRIPDNIYQMLLDMVPDRYATREEVKAKILTEVKSYISQKFPGFVVVDMADINSAEAEKIHPLLQWGMYVQLNKGEYIDGEFPMIENALKQLSNG